MNKMKRFIVSGTVVMSLFVCGISAYAASGEDTLSCGVVYTEGGDSSTSGNISTPSVQPCATDNKTAKKTKVTDKKYEWNAFGEMLSGTYTGEWSNNMPNGEGTIVTKEDGTEITFSGDWVDGVLNGKAYGIITENGDKATIYGTFYKGIYESGTRVVQYKNGGYYAATGDFNENSVLIDGEYVEAKSDGQVIYCNGAYSSSGVIQFGMNAKKYTDGTIVVCIGEYAKGSFYEGDYVIYKSDFSVEASGKYVGGKQYAAKSASDFSLDIFKSSVQKQYPTWARFLEFCAE